MINDFMVSIRRLIERNSFVYVNLAAYSTIHLYGI